MSGSIRLWATMVSNSFPRTETPCHFSTLQIELEIVPDLFDPFGFEHGPELFQDAASLRAASCGDGT